MFAAALVPGALLIGAAGPVAADDEAPKETIGSVAEYVSPSGHVAGAGQALAAPALRQPDPCPGTQT